MSTAKTIALCVWLVAPGTAFAQWLPSPASDAPAPVLEPPSLVERAERAAFVGHSSHSIVVPPFATVELGTCDLPGASHLGDTVVAIIPDGQPFVRNDDAPGCGSGSFVRWINGATPVQTELSVRCHSGPDDCSGVLAWRVRHPLDERRRPLDPAHPIHVSAMLSHGQTLRVDHQSHQGVVEYILQNQHFIVLARRRLTHDGAIELSTSFEPRAEHSLVGRCVEGPCAALVRVTTIVNERHFTPPWEVGFNLRGAIGSDRGLAWGGGGDLRVFAQRGPLALRVETPTIGAAVSSRGGVYAAGARAVIGYAFKGGVVGPGIGVLTLNRRLGGLADRLWPEALAWLRLGNTLFSMDFVLGATLGARAIPALSVAQGTFWAHVSASTEVGLHGAYSIHGEHRVDGAVRVWVAGRGVEPGSWGLSGSLGYAEFFYQAQCPLAPCEEALALRTAALGVGLTWRP
jgi:hypothetical protein